MVTQEFELLDLTHAVDGDTFDGLVRYLSDPVDLDGWRLVTHAEKVIRIRPVHLDTPEDDEPGHDLAKEQLLEWVDIGLHSCGGVMIVVYKRDSFGRYLADVQLTLDRSQTLSDYLVRECGWSVWTG